MLDKIIQFLDERLIDINGLIKRHGKYKIVCSGLRKLISAECYTSDELRKELSIYTKRIISEREFSQILDKEAVEYASILYER